MSKIFELYGYRLDAWNEAAAENLQRAHCPFMGAECDGGGNRQMSAITLADHPQLAAHFPGKTRVQAGVCSLQLNPDQQPWIVCPRRLLSLRTDNFDGHQTHVRTALVQHSGLAAGDYRIWSEVKMKVGTTTEEDEAKLFDYTFDYVIAGQERKRLDEVCEITDLTERRCKSLVVEAGYTLAQREGSIWVDDFPSDPIRIIEIMTSSTSGGNKQHRTQIAMAFEDAIVEANHRGPGINYRQVWARMVSQLIVKSQVALAWNGKTIWLIQDVLADYISSSTALNLGAYISQHTNEVNILALGYGALRTEPISELSSSTFYSGPIATSRDRGGFVEIVKIGAAPPKSQLWKSLALKRHVGVLRVP
ncbi:MAG: hypothetical protein JW395_2091 [Nitrospira sp.]|nr:hypothetical protein [Nitrospira sp.]